MSDVQELGRQVKEELSAADQRRRTQEDSQRRSIVEFQQRHEQFTTIGDWLLDSIVRPRMQKIAEYFKHAHIRDDDDLYNDRSATCSGNSLACLFRYVTVLWCMEPNKFRTSQGAS